MRGERTFARHVTGADAAAFVGASVLSTAVWIVALVALPIMGVSERVASGYGLAGGVTLWMLGIEVARRVRRWSWADLGFVPVTRPGHVWWQVPLAYVGVMLLMALVGWTLLDPASAREDMAAELALGPPAIVLAGVAIVVVGPLVEEIVFRRILLGAFERAGFVLALLAQAVLFGLVHVIPQFMLFAALMGIATGMLARIHRSLWPPLLLHALNNLIAFAAAFALLMD